MGDGAECQYGVDELALLRQLACFASCPVIGCRDLIRRKRRGKPRQLYLIMRVVACVMLSDHLGPQPAAPEVVRKIEVPDGIEDIRTHESSRQFSWLAG